MCTVRECVVQGRVTRALGTCRHTVAAATPFRPGATQTANPTPLGLPFAFLDYGNWTRGAV